MPTLDRNGVHIYYEVHGSGPAILLTHGFSATTEMWKPNIPVLSQRYRLILWDMRGHGQSDSPSDPYRYSADLTVGDMDALLDACGEKQAVLGGHSLGGFMSLAYHLLHPERIRALMLFDTGPGYKKDEARAGWNKRAETIARAFEEKGLEALGRSAEVLTSKHRSAQGLAYAARGMLAQRDARVINSLESITVPTLVLVGDKDDAYFAATDYMASKIPGAKKVVIPDAGHAANIDQPEKFNQAVLEFLSHV
ncbi:MAG TPA: alpha/beta fold hydrolase [Methylomirabilota bacterium]|jgi:pimeloyl-ACP methyl ester carboxylesterase|nr:alpha/beta fold hydrolase [Methylomirabilota bacterium]